MIRNKYLLFIFRLIVGGLFIWAGILKIVNPLEFAQNVKNFRIVSHEISFFTALVLPWMEVICGAFLIVGFFHKSSALLVSIMLVGFIGLVAITMARGIDTSCGCFGSLSRKADFLLILEDSLLCFFSLNVFFSKSYTLILFRKKPLT